MTREEAIKTLKDRIEQYTGGVHPGEREILLEALAALRGPQPDPETGLVPCGCGGKAKIWPSDLRQAVVTAYQVGCIECAMTTDWVRGKQENAVKFWNTAMGYTAPPRPGAIGPEQDRTASNGDKGAEGA